jgi:CYTH domain-containing protein
MEIERKFLVRGEPWHGGDGGTTLRQGYLSTQQNAVVRVRVADTLAWITVKGPTHGISREELEYEIPHADGLLLLGMCDGAIIEKTRYRIPHAGRVWEVDVFAGENAGLVVAEIELAHEAEQFERPAWLGEEVSHDHRYTNSALSQIPYTSWPD